MKKALALATVAALLLGVGSAATAQTAVQLVTQATGQPAPTVVNPTNPLPVTVTGSTSTGSVPTIPGPLTPLGCGQLTSLGSATALSTVSGGIPTGATLASLSVESVSVRYRDDGTNPTASVGTPLPAGLSAWPYTGSMTAIKFIQTAASATVDVCFYK